ncbi:hypothetical protein RhiXN_11078 [Rhizoctonia solani]|uniref:Uncharacterized protein n=1 Tax=Rhizoctonia solani TaxID=456999 RepID=A0A8H8P8Z9_9AGAM|nr:uncharacterized protein RhiXN_11078 [Rhizoctonia solani]QRW26001.1 hypothetical protein RhiXN_11078 [Rhizoctonia solani]
MASKTLNFYAYGLQKDTSLMLMFDPPNKSNFSKINFLLSGVITFRANGHAKATVHYHQRLAFGYAQTDRDNLVDSAAWVEVVSGDISSISGAGQKRFGNNSKGNGTKLLVCKNNTDGRANLSIGFLSGDEFTNATSPHWFGLERYEPTLVWTGVGSKSNITAAFTPVLTAYTRDYKATEMLRGEVETDAIWSCNLNLIDDVTGWHLFEDQASGAFTIEPAIRP